MKLKKVNKRIKQIKLEKILFPNQNQSPYIINHSDIIKEEEEEEEEDKPIHVELNGNMEMYKYILFYI